MELHIEFEDIEPRTWLGNPDSCKIWIWKKSVESISTNHRAVIFRIYKNAAFWLVEEKSFQSTFTKMNKLRVFTRKLPTQNLRYLPFSEYIKKYRKI